MRERETWKILNRGDMKQDLIDEEELKRLYTWYSWNLDVFSSMLPSMPKGEIVSMNANDIPMGEYPSIAGALERLLQ